MKNQLVFLPVLFFIFLFSGCDFFENSTSLIKSDIDIEVESILSNPMEVGETWKGTQDFDLLEELEIRYGVDLEKNELVSFKIIKIATFWQSERCRKLSYISTDFKVPEIDDVKFESGGAEWDLLCSEVGTSASYVNFAEVDESSDPYGITKADFADAINRGEKISIDYTLTADEEIEKEGMALVFVVFSEAEFNPK